ncbi:MAG: hypothetical protein P8X82_16200 [Gemmatimonadales bacterium]|jgi:hypothetical protein
MYLLAKEDFEELQPEGEIEGKTFYFLEPARVWKNGLTLKNCTFYILGTVYKREMGDLPRGEPYSNERIEWRKRYQELFFDQDQDVILFQRYGCKLLVDDGVMPDEVQNEHGVMTLLDGRKLTLEIRPHVPLNCALYPNPEDFTEEDIHWACGRACEMIGEKLGEPTPEQWHRAIQERRVMLAGRS